MKEFSTPVKATLVSAAVALAVWGVWEGSKHTTPHSPIPLTGDFPPNFPGFSSVRPGQTFQPLNKNPQLILRESIGQSTEVLLDLKHKDPPFSIKYSDQTYYSAISEKETTEFGGIIAEFLKSGNYSSEITIAYENTLGLTLEDYVRDRLKKIKEKDPGAKILGKREVANSEAIVLHRKPEQDVLPDQEFSVIFFANGNAWTISLHTFLANDPFSDYIEKKLQEFGKILDSFTFPTS